MKIKFVSLTGLMVLAVSAGICFLAAPAWGVEPVVPVSSGTTITVYEQTGVIYETTFPVSDLMTTGGEFLTKAGEKYTVTSDGTYLTILCLHDRYLFQAETEKWTASDQGELSPLPYEDLVGHPAGNNIVAVRLDGDPDFPAGLWASFIVGYTLGERGIAESRFNALGNALTNGPYAERHYSILGSGRSGITLGFSPVLDVAVELGEAQPWDDALTVYFKLPEGYDATDILFHSVELAEVGGQAAGILPLGWWSVNDHDGDGVADLRMQFSLRDINNYLLPGDNLLLIRGSLSSGIALEGRATLSVK